MANRGYVKITLLFLQCVCVRCYKNNDSTSPIQSQTGTSSGLSMRLYVVPIPASVSDMMATQEH